MRSGPRVQLNSNTPMRRKDRPLTEENYIIVLSTAHSLKRITRHSHTIEWCKTNNIGKQIAIVATPLMRAPDLHVTVGSSPFV